MEMATEIRAIRPEWDPEFSGPDCGLDEGPSTVLDDALALTGLTQETFTSSQDDMNKSTFFGSSYVDDAFKLSWFSEVRAQPVRAGCFEGELAGSVDHYLGQAHPIAGMIRMRRPMWTCPSRRASRSGLGNAPGDFDAAVEQLCNTVGCEDPEGELPPQLARDLTPILWAINAGIDARLAMDASEGGNGGWWHANGGG